MSDRELKKLLLETCPVRPGQEERAWTALRDRLYRTPTPSRTWLSHLTWHRMTAGLLTVCALIFINTSLFAPPEPIPFASAESKTPGVYATSFYSPDAKAQVVWLNGMEPATDQPTYLDPTTVVPSSRQHPKSSGDPDSL